MCLSPVAPASPCATGWLDLWSVRPTFPVWPAFSMAVMSSSHPSRLFLMLGANPPSSPTLQASVPYLALMTDLRAWYT